VLNEILILFGFSKLTYMIGIVCMLTLLGNFLGGLLHGILLGFGGPIKPRKLSDRMSVRACLMSELFIVIFAFYYHVMLIEDVVLAHVVYWAFTLLAAPILAFIGSQVTQLIFADKIEVNKRAYKDWVKVQRAQKAVARDKKKAPPSKRSGRSFDHST
jgi:hypothetical protein